MWWIPQQDWWYSTDEHTKAYAAYSPRWNGASRSGPSRPFSAVPTWYPRTRNALPGRQTISGTAPSPVPVSVTAPAPWVWKSLPKQCPPLCLPAQAWYGRRPLSQGHPQAEKRVDRHAEPANPGIKTPGYLILPVRGARYPGVLSITESDSSAPLCGFSPDHSRKVGALPDKRTSRAETRGASAEAVHRSAAVRCGRDSC